MPKGHPKSTCGDYGGTNRRGEPCGRSAGWGIPSADSGKCRRHRGTSPDGSSHEGNQNAVGNDGGAPEENGNAITHGLYAEANKTYSEVFTDAEREIADRTFADYMERYTARHGEPPYGHEVKLFQISVNMAKEIHGESWAADKPETLESGNLLIDRETRIKTTADPTQNVRERRYKKTAVMAAQKTLSNDTRQWLKEFDLLEGPEKQTANAIQSFGAAIKQAKSGSGSEGDSE